MDRGIYPGSRIKRLPKLLRPLAVTVRNAMDGFARRGFTFEGDGMLTRHNFAALSTPDFDAAYCRSIEAAGQDFLIRNRVHQALWCAGSAPDGSFVELGTGRGFIMSAVMHQHPNRTLHLFDTSPLSG